jgi:CRP/FNR family transcriptional regulator, cyclic AMP receptor protein
MGQQAISRISMGNLDRTWHLEQTALLEGFSSGELEPMVSDSVDRIFDRNEIIFHQGDVAGALYIVNRGTVLLTIANSKGRRKIVSILRNGEIFGEDLLRTPPHHRLQASAYEESWISVLSGERLIELLRENAVLARNLLGIVLGRLDEARTQIGALSLMNTETRLASVLLQLAENLGRPNRLRDQSVKLKIRMPHEQLAELVGANRPHISAILSDFKRKGWIDYRNHKLVIDAEALREKLTGE